MTTGAPTTFGVEEELGVVDRRTGRLAAAAEPVLARLDPTWRDQVGLELRTCMVETASPVSTTLDELRTAIEGSRAALAQAAAELDCGISAGGSHPSSAHLEQPFAQVPSYQRLVDDYQHLAFEQVLFGCHVHVGVDGDDERIAVLDRIRTRLAPLLAVTASSPFWEGRDTGYASYRYVTFARWPTFVTPAPLGDWAGYRALVDRLVGSGAIDDPARLYWTARPSARYPTVELRIFDGCLTVDESLMAAALARALVATALAEARAGMAVPDAPVEAVRLAEWHAARHGLDRDLLDPVRNEAEPAVVAVRRLVDHLGPALEAAGDLEHVERTVRRILAVGNGATRQRAVHAATGSFRDVVRYLQVDGAGAHLDAEPGSWWSPDVGFEPEPWWEAPLRPPIRPHPHPATRGVHAEVPLG